MECIVILAMGLFLSAPPVEDVRAAAADVYRDEDLQTHFPRGAAQEPERQPAPREAVKAPDAANSAVHALLWVLIAAAVAIAAFFLAQRLGGYTADVEARQGAAGATAAPRAPPPADEARRLAAEGRYAEAIHLLLLLAIHPLTRERHVAGSLTSREIVRSVEMPADARKAIEGLTLAVEISVFGGRPPTRTDFDVCAQQFDRYCSTLGVAPA